MRYYWVMVEHYYTKPFMELFLEPRPKFNLPDAIVAVLAGELEGGWRLELRRQVFFLLARAQKHWPVAPRISFEDLPNQELKSHSKATKNCTQIPL